MHRSTKQGDMNGVSGTMNHIIESGTDWKMNPFCP